MNTGTTIADYLDGIRYRRYSRSVLIERRRLLAHAAVCGDTAWLAETPAPEVVATVRDRLGFRSPTQSRRLEAVVNDYQAWCRRAVARDPGP